MSQLPWNKIGLVGGSSIFILMVLFFNPTPDRPEVGLMAAVATVMAIFWITEAIPLAATALIPLVALPLTGILDSRTVSKAYINSMIFLFIGGFLIALAMERWNLHRRIALNIIRRAGRRADYMVLGFMVASGFLSMWISNVATTVMMLPIGLAIISKMEEAFGEKRTHLLSVVLMLGIAYACSIGGVATLVGTPTNLAFVQIFHELFPDSPFIAFGEWMIIGIPYAVVMVGITWFLLTRVIYPIDLSLHLDREIVDRELRELGPLKSGELRILVVFCITVVLWTFRRDLNVGVLQIPGWSGLWEGFRNTDDGTIAIAMALLLFFLPAGKDHPSIRLLDKDIFKKIPWDVIILFGGGYALAGGFVSSGLAQFIGESFPVSDGVPPWVYVLLICLGITFLTELSSNSATLSMMLPILAGLAVSLNINPLLFAIPATISASMAFMMPVATPPNAVIFGSRRLQIYEMAKAGLVLNFVATVLTVIALYLFFPYVAGAPVDSFPEWATGME